MFKVKFWGVRGSIPVSGPNTMKFGGNTSCVEVNCDGEAIIIDAGTGLRPLGLDLANRPNITGAGGKISILFSHVHWDHIQGFPFFRPAFIPGQVINLYGSLHSDIDVEVALRGQMVAPHFPLGLRDMPSKISFKGLKTGEELKIGDVTILNTPLNHPNGALGYRVIYKGKSIVYISDHEDLGEPDQSLVNFSKGAKLCIYDAMYTPEEYVGTGNGTGRKGWGHSTWQGGIKLSKKAEIEKLALFHHGREDEGILKIESIAQKKFKNTIAAYEGLVVDI